MEWYSELQPLMKKDGQTIATAIISAISDIVDLACKSAPDPAFRFLHLIVGDAINTNENAMKRVLFHFRHIAQARGFRYFCLVWKCGSHQSNLVAVVAVCGVFRSKPQDNDSLTANCVCFYKYLAPDNCEEFGHNLRQYLINSLSLVDRDPFVMLISSSRNMPSQRFRVRFCGEAMFLVLVAVCGMCKVIEAMPHIASQRF